MNDLELNDQVNIINKQNRTKFTRGRNWKPMYYEKIIGKKSVKNLSPGTPFDLKFIK